MLVTVSMQQVSFRLPQDELERLDGYVTDSTEFDKRSPAVRHAVRELLQEQ